MRNLGYFRTYSKTIESELWRTGDTGEAVDIIPTELTDSDIKWEADQDKTSHMSEVKEGERPERRDDWHVKDIEIEEHQFFEVVEAAIKFMYTQGPWSFDMD